MKRFAAHYIIYPQKGCFKQSFVEMDNGQVIAIRPFTEEVEDVEWYPGVIELIYNEENKRWIPYLYYPYDFKTMQPVAETQRKLLL